MLHYTLYRKFVRPAPGQEVLLRLLHPHDLDDLLRMFREAPAEDRRFFQYPLESPGLAHTWLENFNYCKILPLIAVDWRAHRVVAAAVLRREHQGADLGGRVCLFVPGPFRGLGLGGIMLKELVELAGSENLRWLKAEVVARDQGAVQAFLDNGFKIKTTLDDYFLGTNGKGYDVFLMVRGILGTRRNPEPASTIIGYET